MLFRSFDKKQNYTAQFLEDLILNPKLIEVFSQLKQSGFLIACCSNSIRTSVLSMLEKIGIINFFDLIIQNPGIQLLKPSTIYITNEHKLKIRELLNQMNEIIINSNKEFSEFVSKHGNYKTKYENLLESIKNVIDENNDSDDDYDY